MTLTCKPFTNVRNQRVRRPASSPAQEDIRRWFQEEQLPLRAGYLADSDSIAPWFHGECAALTLAAGEPAGGQDKGSLPLEPPQRAPERLSEGGFSQLSQGAAGTCQVGRSLGGCQQRLVDHSRWTPWGDWQGIAPWAPAQGTRLCPPWMAAPSVRPPPPSREGPPDVVGRAQAT